MQIDVGCEVISQEYLVPLSDMLSDIAGKVLLGNKWEMTLIIYPSPLSTQHYLCHNVMVFKKNFYNNDQFCCNHYFMLSSSQSDRILFSSVIYHGSLFRMTNDVTIYNHHW